MDYCCKSVLLSYYFVSIFQVFMGEKLQRNCLIENIRENDMTYLPIGSIVQLENGTAKLMITTRFALL